MMRPPLAQALRECVLLINTAAGNPEWRNSTAADWGGEQFRWSASLNVHRPDLVLHWAQDLCTAGADALDTLTTTA